MSKKLSTQAYPGMRDFYPTDWAVQQYIFDTWRKTCQQFGFEEYQTPLLESFDLFAAKSGEELVKKQLYTFADRAGRRVALRPEMTPSVARLIAARQQTLPKPIKWFSLASFYRYERPQKGRVREFWQLNADIFGVERVTADFEILQLNRAIMDAFGANPSTYEIRVNNRKLMDYVYKEAIGITNLSLLPLLSRLIDKKGKISADEFKIGLGKLGLTLSQQRTLGEILGWDLNCLKAFRDRAPGAQELLTLFELLKRAGIAEGVVFSPATVRGFDYYDGTIFEQFDLHPESRRSMFGGGRYNSLLNIFGQERIPAQGFAPGDVTTADFLRNWNLLPKNLTQIQAQALVTVFAQDFDKFFPASAQLAQKLRQQGSTVELILEKQTLSKQLSLASRKKIPWAVILGPEEQQASLVTLKNMQTGKQERLKPEQIGAKIRNPN